jgi:hypothetical protein
MRDLGFLGTEVSRFDSISTINWEGFDRAPLFGSIFRTIGSIPIGMGKSQSDRVCITIARRAFSALRKTNTLEELGKLLMNACQSIEIPGFANPRERLSFNDISEALKAKHFRITDGIDLNDVSAFVSLVESSET